MTNLDTHSVISTLHALQPRLQNEGIRHLSLFGSFARGTQGYFSDIDILATLDHSKNLSLFDVMHIQEELSRQFGRKVDLCTELKPTAAALVGKDMIDVF